MKYILLCIYISDGESKKYDKILVGLELCWKLGIDTIDAEKKLQCVVLSVPAARAIWCYASCHSGNQRLYMDS